MSDQDYTPTDDDIAVAYEHWGTSGDDWNYEQLKAQNRAEYSRWLIAHDAEVARVAAEKAWDEGARRICMMLDDEHDFDTFWAPMNPYRIGVEHE